MAGNYNVWGSQEYYEHEVKLANTRLAMVKGWLAEMLTRGEVIVEDLETYTEVLSDAQRKADAANADLENYLNEHTSRDNAE